METAYLAEFAAGGAAFSFHRAKHAAVMTAVDPFDESMWSSGVLLNYLRVHANLSSDAALATATRRCKNALATAFLSNRDGTTVAACAREVLELLNGARATKDAAKGPKIPAAERARAKASAEADAGRSWLSAYAAWEAGNSEIGTWDVTPADKDTAAALTWVVARLMDPTALSEPEFATGCALAQRLVEDTRKVGPPVCVAILFHYGARLLYGLRRLGAVHI